MFFSTYMLFIVKQWTQHCGLFPGIYVNEVWVSVGDVLSLFRWVFMDLTNRPCLCIYMQTKHLELKTLLRKDLPEKEYIEQ